MRINFEEFFQSAFLAKGDATSAAPATGSVTAGASVSV